MPGAHAAAVTVDVVTVGPFEENCYLVADDATGTAVLVDPGDDAPQIIRMAERHRLTPSAVWLTHAHLDHIGAVAAVRRAWPGIPVYLHPLDSAVYSNGWQSAREYGVPFEQPDAADRTLSEGEVLPLGHARFTVWHLPGHAPGHVAFIAHGLALSGDCLFLGSVGRTDLPMCDPSAFGRSLARLATLPAGTMVYAGHGPATTVGRELTSNPYLRGMPARIVSVADGPPAARDRHVG